jgi:class 3 adenylate cyclase
MRPSFAHPRSALLVAVLTVTLAGCASLPPPTGELAAAQQAVARAAQADAEQYAAAEFAAAQNELSQAQAAMSAGRDDDARRLALLADADAALAAARAILARLPGWNEQYNLLPRPFEVRVGIHTGRSAVDLERGVAYSSVLDRAGHLQKAAPVGGLLLSKETWLALSTRDGLVPAPVAGRDGLEAYGLA